jgi:uncharacterized protein
MSELDEGIQAYEELDFIRAFEILIVLAYAGEAEAQKIIGHIYSFGQGRDQNDDEAIKWYKLAAEGGDRVAQNNLGSYLLEENIDEAIKWYTASAEQNLVFSQETLGDIYSGILISSEKYRNDLEALKWYEKGSNSGSLTCCYKLGKLYTESLSIPINEVEALKWYQKSAESGYAPSQLILFEAYRDGLLNLPQDNQKAQYWRDKYNLSSNIS